MKSLLVSSALATVLATGGSALADGAPKREPGPRVVTLKVVEIVGRGRPVAAIEVSKDAAALAPKDLAQHFLGQVEDGVARDPF